MRDDPTDLCVVDGLRDEQRRQWRQGTPVRAEDLLARHPLVRADPDAALEVIYHEVVLRAAAGEDPQLPEYASRFPDLASRLGPLFEVHRALERGTLAGGITASGPHSTDYANPPTYSAAEAPPGYELLGRIGLGGMGEVYRARDTVLDRDVAVKLLRDRYPSDGPAARRFQDEARITGQLQHPGIPPVHQAGTLPDSRPFLVMKLIKGRTLAELLSDPADPVAGRGALVAAFEQVCQAVGYAHAHRVVHRDLKPANVMVGAFGEVQVMDWGLAKVLTEGRAPPAAAGRGEPESETEIHTLRTPEASTQAGSILGTPAFMAPEQAGGETAKIDERSDVFGLGAVLCTILTGQPPYVGENSESVALMAVRGQLAGALARLDGCGADPDLVALCKRCLAAERTDRPRHAGEVAAAVAGLRTAADERARRAELDRVRAEADRRAAELRAADERKRRRTQLALAGTLVALVAAAGAGAWYVQVQRDERRLQGQALAEQERRVRDGTEAALGRLPDLYRRALWPQAAAALGQAEEMLGSDGDPALRARVAGARADTAFLERLDRIRLEKATVVRGKLDHVAALPKYAAAFLEHGYDVQATDPPGLAARLNASPVREYLLAALDDWGLTGTVSPDRVRIFAVTALATGQEWRPKLPAAWGDAKQLAAMYDAIPLDHRSPALIAQVGWRLNELGADGVRRLEEGLWLYPSDFWLHTWLGIMDSKGRAEAQVGACRAALAVRPGTAAIYVNLGKVLFEKGDPHGAVTALTEAVRLDSVNATAHSNLGGALNHIGEPDAAIVACRKAIRLDPDHSAAYSNLGAALSAKGDPNSAIEALTKAARFDPNEPKIHDNLGLAFMEKRTPDRALIAFGEAIRLDPMTARYHTHLGVARRATGDPKGAADAYREAIRLDSGHALAHHNLGILLRDGGHPDEAIAAFRKAIECDPKYALAHSSLGGALLAKGDSVGAVAAFREVTRFAPQNAEAHYNLGVALRATADPHGTVAACREAIRLDPKYAAAHRNLGGALYLIGKLDGAIAAYKEAIQLEPKNAMAHNNLGMAFRDKGDLDEALASYMEALRWAPDDARYKTNLRKTERWRELLPRIADVTAGRAEPKTPAEALELASLSAQPFQRRYALAARLSAGAFAADPSLAANLGTLHQYNAACWAALAAAGRDAHAPDDSAERARLRQQALDWLRDELVALSWAQADGPPQSAPEVARRLREWQQDSDLAAVRGDASLALLPENERAAWARLWADAAELLRRAEAAK